MHQPLHFNRPALFITLILNGLQSCDSTLATIIHRIQQMLGASTVVVIGCTDLPKTARPQPFAYSIFMNTFLSFHILLYHCLSYATDWIKRNQPKLVSILALTFLRLSPWSAATNRPGYRLRYRHHQFGSFSCLWGVWTVYHLYALLWFSTLLGRYGWYYHLCLCQCERIHNRQKFSRPIHRQYEV